MKKIGLLLFVVVSVIAAIVLVGLFVTHPNLGTFILMLPVLKIVDSFLPEMIEKTSFYKKMEEYSQKYAQKA